jgi:DNA-binding NarL/FixJ family response regulator
VQDGGGSILLVDDDADLREAVGDLIEMLSGVRVLRVAGYQELLARRSEAMHCRLAIVDINLGAGKPSGYDVYQWLRDLHYPGQVVFLTGHALGHPLVQRACALGDARVYSKPISVAELQHVLEDPEPEPEPVRPAVAGARARYASGGRR